LRFKGRKKQPSAALLAQELGGEFMRKVLVVLLVLFVLGGLSAQGNWSVSGNVEIGAIFDFDTDPDPATVTGGAYWDWDVPRGILELNYSNDGFGGMIEFHTSGNVWLEMNYAGENFAFQAGTDLINFFNVFEGDINGTEIEGSLSGSRAPGSLWGYYQFFDGLIHLEAAYASRDTNFWTSSQVVGDVFNDWDFVSMFGYWNNTTGAGLYDLGWGFADVDGDNYFAVDFTFAGMNFGVMLYDLFDMDGDELVDGVLQNMVLGLMFDMDNIEFAVQFDMANYGAYLGATLSLGALSFELGFQGLFDTDAFPEETVAAFAAGVSYSTDLFGAALKAGYLIAPTDDNENVIGVLPSFYYNVLPDHMRLMLDAGFWFTESDFHWAFMPQIWWNFKGDGAIGNYWWYPGGPQTAIYIKYFMERDSANELTIAFKWSF
jgi:hypothetical protein